MARASSPQRQDIRQAAAEWVIRLSAGDVAPCDHAAFEAWRDADPAHEAAYEREAAAWTGLDRLRALRPGNGFPDPDLLAPRRSTSRPAQRTASWRRPWAVAAGFILMFGLVTTLTVSTLISPAYATAVGERRVVVLPDRTRMELNTNSKVVVRYRRGQREVELVRGEAVFEVAADRRPFIIATPDGRLAAGGAELAVRLISADEASVVVRQGKVAAMNPAGREVASLTRAQTALLNDGQAHVHTVDPGEVDRRLAWRQGAIALDGQSLAEACAEFNRYNDQKIILMDAETASLKLGGYFRTSDIDGFVSAVTDVFPVTAETTPKGEIRLRQAS
ncbi:FecR family protein [Brevundimonas diminuta]|uniref:FecR family protein n=1 Tax=Brevundimonas diminuta TaxID=293 RepID=UPI003D0309D6